MQKRFVRIGLVLTATVLLVSLIAGHTQPASVPAPAAAPKPREAVKLRLATGPVQWGMYGLSVVVAKILNENTHLEVTVESTSGVPAILQAVTDGIMEMAGPNDVGPTGDNYRGAGDWQGQPHKNLRLLIGLGGIYFSYITKSASGIKNIPELKGKRVPYYTRGRGNWVFFDAVLTAYGLKPRTDVKEVRLGNDAEAVEDLIMGRVAAMQVAANSRKLLPLQQAVGKIVFLPIEREKILQAKVAQPELMKARYPTLLTPEYLAGIKMSGPVPAVIAPIALTSSTALPDAVAYTIAKTILDHYKDYQASASDFTLENAAFVPEVPFHPGSIKAFKELGLWTDEMERAQQALLARK